ncbi:hypothetical protein RclHR1_09190003 [Rhizophagus clarus]|uniref:Uncharacterized protein n=1 Tax=Rhizophagus clarus TaxID=94130 RepID=A0A2Z6SPR9_9GLOM|nr:hypothetical protein RclHR1_09190003 [Rhizophagus clarus]
MDVLCFSYGWKFLERSVIKNLLDNYPSSRRTSCKPSRYLSFLIPWTCCASVMDGNSWKDPSSKICLTTTQAQGVHPANPPDI